MEYSDDGAAVDQRGQRELTIAGGGARRRRAIAAWARAAWMVPERSAEGTDARRGLPHSIILGS